MLLDSEILAFQMPGMDVQIHQHAGYQIVYAFDNVFNTVVSGHNYLGIKGFIIRPQLAHACYGVSGKFAIINVEPDSLAGRMIDKILGEKDINVFQSSDQICKLLNISCDGVEPIYAALLHLRSISQLNDFEPRIKKVVEMIRCKSTDAITPSSLAASVHLSPSRLSALFKQQTGSSLSKFLLWTRLRQAIHLLLTDDRNLSEIAVFTGFYDSANFNKYMQKMIGVPPIAFRKNSNLVQFI